MMSTKLKGLYKSLTLFPVATQVRMCADLTRGARRLAEWFVDALERNSAFDNREQPFLNPAAITARLAITPDDPRDNSVISLMAGRGVVGVDHGPEGYGFRYVQRQVPPLRREGMGDPHGGAGGIDYIARTGGTPILGEVKWRTDQNAFYAFIQLLAYLSEMAMPNQIERANRHGTFGADIGTQPSFDLHILLADRNVRSAKEALIIPTRDLASSFRMALLDLDPDMARAVGQILCIEMSTAEFRRSPESTLRCLWSV